jgi:hypothetical protein
MFFVGARGKNNFPIFALAVLAIEVSKTPCFFDVLRLNGLDRKVHPFCAFIRDAEKVNLLEKIEG